jgi:leader peptidase (prepilin peptidase) / N-methyltransferase
MNLTWAIAGAAIGMPLGAVARSTVFQLSVPSGAPDRGDCPCCCAPVLPRAVLSCGYCGSSFGRPGVLELPTAAVLALLLGRFGDSPQAIPFIFLGALGVALAAIDISVQRLPDRLVLPAFPLLISLLAVTAVLERDGAGLVRALLGSLALGAGFLVLALLRPGQLGGGDIKLAGLAGLALGWLGWPAVITAAVLSFSLSAVTSLALLAARRVRLSSAVCFGPFLLGGALVAILVAGHRLR